MTAANGRIFALGGFANSEALATVEEYDPTTDQWAAATPMSTAYPLERWRLFVAF